MAWWERVVALAAGVSLILAMPLTDELGFGLGALVIVQHIWRGAARAPQRPDPRCCCCAWAWPVRSRHSYR